MDISMAKLLSFWMVTFCASQAWADNSGSWSQEDRDQILEIHNDKRDKEEACYMNKLVYDMELERQAERWAKKCTFEHENVDGRGENLAMDGSRASNNNPRIKKLTEMWYNEKNFFSYGQDFCDQSCHYTQMIWADTTNIGCYATQCDRFWYLVCFYTPPGNYYGEDPYTKSCESQCREGQVAEGHLCVDNDREDDGQDDNSANLQIASSGEESGSEDSRKNNKEEDSSNASQEANEEQCVDENTSCAWWAKNGECEKNPGWMKNNCRFSCNVCEKQCIDEHKSCASWANNGECEKNPGWMKNFCRFSCNVCDNSAALLAASSAEENGVEDSRKNNKEEDSSNASQEANGTDGSQEGGSNEVNSEENSGGENNEQNKQENSNDLSRQGDTEDPCTDKFIDRCWLWATAGFCENLFYSSYMSDNCRYSCGVCKDDCVNSFHNCPTLANEDSCNNDVLISNNCKASCGVCESRMPCQDYNLECSVMAEMGMCEDDSEFMLDICRKSCRQC